MDDLTRRGLKVVSQLEENEDNPDTFDIVIVHGLHGSFDKDWSESLSSDEDFNFVIRRSFRLLAYDHDMSLSSRQSILEELAFQKLALSLLEEIAKEAVKEVSKYPV
ncbi:hypothetical protein J7337_003663 [Fusarium musae]|uniref:Uncharacterized protein n=1 Tax=Fusarium musae TaxID=1042133 RepID=A0A9P8DKQ2_9HYPO|nr:hypothetical protein J7337_003663 [Fusarium musae]KAG9503710.1 hypothetical protein J7337_003663 [Fusarium musae]